MHPGEATYGRDILRALAGVTRYGVVVRDSRRHIVFANEGASRMLRIPPDRFRGASPVRKAGVRLIDPSGFDLSWDESPFEIASRKKQPLVDHRYGVRFPDGETRWHVGTYVPLLRVNGSVSRVITIYTDASPRPDYEDVSTTLMETTVKLREAGYWLRDDVLQTVLGVSLGLQNHLTEQPGAGKARGEIESAISSLHDLGSRVRRAATDLIRQRTRSSQ
jgi:hypothetical protein